MGAFRFVESIALADCAIDLAGATLDDLFETAARALAETMVDPATVAPVVERTITLSAPSLDLLLYDWLSELIYLKDREGLLFPGAAVHVHPGPPCALSARVAGAPIDPERMALRADAKAVTFHQFALERRDGGWWARVVIDL
jgi:SHS2 domain-containing protein